MYRFGNWQLRWLGHDSFQLTNPGRTIYIDPFEVDRGRPADYIFITHEHYDHFDKTSLDRLANINTVFFGPKSVTDQFDDHVAITLLPGETHEAQEMSVQAVAAYNINKDFHPKQDSKLGYIIKLDNHRLYHAGDTDLIPEMDSLGEIDIALLPVSGKYVMTAAEAVAAVKTIKPAVAIPMHYNSIVGSLTDAQHFATKARDLTQVIVLEKEAPR